MASNESTEDCENLIRSRDAITDRLRSLFYIAGTPCDLILQALISTRHGPLVIPFYQTVSSSAGYRFCERIR